MFYLNSTLNFGIPPVLVFQLEVYYKVDRFLTGLTAYHKGTTARWYSNKTSLCPNSYVKRNYDLKQVATHFLVRCLKYAAYFWGAPQSSLLLF